MTCCIMKPNINRVFSFILLIYQIKELFTYVRTHIDNDLNKKSGIFLFLYFHTVNS